MPCNLDPRLFWHSSFAVVKLDVSAVNIIQHNETTNFKVKLNMATFKIDDVEYDIKNSTQRKNVLSGYIKNHCRRKVRP